MTYRVGAIGTAWAARSPLPTFQTYDGVELAAVCSARMERAKATADQFGAPLAYDDFEQMIREADLDIVYVGAPVYLHHPMTLTAAAAGKHILCEKPLARNIAEGREMLDACESRGLAHVSAFTMRHFPSSLYIRQLIDEGFLGTLRHVNAVQFFGFPAGGPLRPWTWLNDADKGGGLLGALGSHLIDLSRFFGVEFETVTGQTRTWTTEAAGDNGPVPATADDSFAMLATIQGGGLMTIHFSAGIRPGTGRRVELYGDKGTIVIGDTDDTIQVAGPGDRALRTVEVPRPTFSETVAKTTVPRFGLMVEKLITQIEGGERATPNLEDALRCQEVMDAIRISQAENRTVAISELR